MTKETRYKLSAFATPKDGRLMADGRPCVYRWAFLSPFNTRAEVNAEKERLREVAIRHDCTINFSLIETTTKVLTSN